jgi:uncharacterized protein YndB with AHSA1/START domain
MTTESTDRIEREILLKAPQARVWRALANAEEFGAWFQVAFEGKVFVAGQPISGRFTVPGYEHLSFNAQIVEIEPERRLSMRWHPYAVDPAVDYSHEPTTLIEFELRAVGGGTLLRVVESGFDKVPAARRAEAFRMNSAGWAQQLLNIEQYVDAR